MFCKEKFRLFAGKIGKKRYAYSDIFQNNLTKMIQVNKNDSIVDIIQKMKDEKGEKIILDFPFGHPILHNFISLKILKIKAEKKELVISTNDKTAQKIGRKLGIKYSVSSNSDVVGYNYNFWEFLMYTIKGYFQSLKEAITSKGKKSSLYKYQQIHGKGKIGIFLAFLILSIILLFFVFYFAVNKTYVYITPEIEIKDRGKNFIFKELGEEQVVLDDRIIKLKKIEKTIDAKDTFRTSGVKSDNMSSAIGTVTLYNLLENDVELVAKTRLATEDGLVFLIQGEAKIPKADTSGLKIEPGKTEVKVIARDKDENGDIIGERGNVKAETVFFLPGLKDNKDKIYAINQEAFTNGKNNFTKILAKDDIENATNILKTKLNKKALDSIKEDLKEENEINNISYQILDVDNAIRYKDYSISGGEDLKTGEELEKFELFGTVKIIAYTYNKDSLIGKMNTTIKQNILSEVEKILKINNDSLRIVYELGRSENPLEIKATAEIEVFYIQNFLNKESNYVEKLKNDILGKDITEAKRILQNNKHISKVSIKTRPFFISNISKLPENIEFIVEE